jgi:hypothetical protein
MKKTALYRIKKAIGYTITAEKCPEIRWDNVVRIEAFGTDVVSAFAIMVTFFYNDGMKMAVHPEQKGYYQIVESLDQRFPSIAEDWFTEMQEAGKEDCDVYRLLYSLPVVS